MMVLASLLRTYARVGTRRIESGFPGRRGSRPNRKTVLFLIARPPLLALLHPPSRSYELDEAIETAERLGARESAGGTRGGRLSS